MIEVKRREDVIPDARDDKAIWRLLENEGMADPVRTAAGIVEYRSPESGTPELGGSHEYPEYYYVIDGNGVVDIETETARIGPGDTFSIPGGARHSIYGARGTTVTVFYVALLARG